MKKLLGALLTAVVAITAVFTFTSCSSSELIVYTEAGFAPFEYVSNGNIVGVDVDIMAKVGEKLGKKVKFENVAFDTIVDAVNKGKLTNVGAAGISITDERKEKVDFSVPYYTANLYVVYKASESSLESATTDDVTGVYWNSLQGKKIGIQGGTTADLFIGDELKEGGALYGNSEPTKYQAYAVALSDIGKNIDVIIMDELPAKQLIKNKAEYKCAPLYYKGGDGENDEIAYDEYAIAVTKGKTEILEAINEVLNSLIQDVDENGNNGIQKLVMKHLGM